MQKDVKRIVIKIVICVIVLVVARNVINSYEPILNNDIAIQQLNGGDYEFAQMTAYNQTKNYAGLGYIVFLLFMFGSEVLRLFKAIFKNVKDN